MSYPAIPVQMLEKSVTKKSVAALLREAGKRVQIKDKIGGLGRLNININETVKSLISTT
jgi:hypothetical protein